MLVETKTKEILKDIAYQNSLKRNGQITELLRYRGLEKFADEGVHNVKRAKVIGYLFDHYPLEINDRELLVGRPSTAPCTEEEITELEGYKALYKKIGNKPASAMSGGTGHRVIDYEKVLEGGVAGIFEDIERKENTLEESDEDYARKLHFYNACRISLNGLLSFAGRFHDMLLELYEAEQKPERRSELKKLAAIFAHTPLNPPKDFYEAIQCLWFLQFAIGLADDNSLTGRFDSYLYPYYQSDIENGTLTRKLAMELIENFYYKKNEMYGTWPASLLVGGYDRSGNPVTNELTGMCIEAIETTGLINPSVGLCYNQHTPDEILLKCVDTIAKGYTKPSIFNDKVIIDGLLDAGTAIEDARCYIHSTCVEITPIGCSHIYVTNPYINTVKAIEYVLNGGEDMFSGEDNGGYNAHIPVDAAALTTFDDFYAGFKTTLAGMIRTAVHVSLERVYTASTYGSTPLVSCFTRDCIERGLDSAAGGAKYHYVYPCFPGFSTAVDSLAAIREVVYEKEMVDLAGLKKILADDFEDSESFRQYLINKCPKYGNDDDKVDSIAVDLYEFIREEYKKYKTCVGGTFHPSYFSWVMHAAMGKVAVATPDGRKRGEAVSECLGPVQGRDKNGPTAVVNTLAKIDQKYGIGGIAANFRFARQLLSTESGRTTLVQFIRQCMDAGCFEIQFNVVDKEVLLEARANPEKYSTLMVRVAGYSDYFVNLRPEIQDEILSRTEHGRF